MTPHSAAGPRLDTGGWLTLTRRGLPPRKIRRAFLGAITIYGKGSLVPHTDIPIPPVDYGNIAVAYFLHNKGQAFTEDPQLYMTRHWKVDGGKLILLEQY